MTCQSAACDAVEHLVLWQDAGEISPGGRGEKRRVWGERGVVGFRGKMGEGLEVRGG